jgi:2-phosphoglycerate kinase
MNLMANNYEIINFTRFRYIEENETMVTFIEYILEINVIKNNKKSTKFYERTNSSYDRFKGKNYFEYLQYVSYIEYFPDKYEDKYVQSMNHLLNIKI